MSGGEPAQPDTRPELVSELAVTESGEIPPAPECAPSDHGEAQPSSTPPPESPGPDSSTATRSGWALAIAMLALAFTMAPYLFGLLLAGAQPRFGWYSWLAFNLDDSTVYLSWMRQAADGHLFQHNLFTTHPQVGRNTSLFFLLLGNAARFTHLPLMAVWHGARLLLGAALLMAVWRLICTLIVPQRARQAAYLLVCFSAGFGWIPGLWAEAGFSAPIDVWQPEAITFLSLYLNPLNLVSLLLMVGALSGLLAAERKQRLRPALGAGVCGFLLGNIHPYDVITLCVVWGIFLVARDATRRRFHAGSWLRALAALAPTALSTGYTYYLLRTEEVFARRAAVATLSAPPALVALGFGIPLLLAIYGLWLLGRGRAFTVEMRDRVNGRDCALLLAAWGAGNLIAAWLPFPFQRKMLMGEHLPLCILGGLGFWWLTRGLRGAAWPLALAAAAGVAAVTNLRFMLRDAANFQADRAQSGIHRPYLYPGEVKALAWIREHAEPGAAVQPLPWIRLQDGKVGFFDTTVAAFTPGLSGHPVNAGHWGETPDFGDTMGLWRQFQLPNTSDQTRTDLLRLTGVRYVIFTQKHDETNDPSTESALLGMMRSAPPRQLRLIPEASNEDADVYAVILYGKGSASTSRK